MLNHLLNIVSYFCLKKWDVVIIIITIIIIIIIIIIIVVIIVIIIIIPCLLSLPFFSFSPFLSFSFFLFDVILIFKKQLRLQYSYGDTIKYGMLQLALFLHADTLMVDWCINFVTQTEIRRPFGTMTQVSPVT